MIFDINEYFIKTMKN